MLAGAADTGPRAGWGRLVIRRAASAGLGVLLLALLSACVTPGPRPERPTPLDATRLGGASASVAMPAVAQDWWRAFGDAQLDALVAQALAGSPSIALARARVRSAQAAAEAVGNPWRPEVGGSASITRERISANGFYPPPIGGETITDAQYGLSLSWDLDLWGRRRSTLQAADYRARAAAVDAADARLVLSAALVKAYLDLDRAFRVLDTAQASRASRASILALTQDRRRAGLDTEVEVESARGGVAAADGDVASAQETIGLARHQIAALVGAGPALGDALTRPVLQAGPSLGTYDELPAALVARRADVAANQLRVEAAARDIDVARTAFYPNINLAATLGMDTITPGHLLNGASRGWSIGPALTLPIYGHSALRGNLHGADAGYEQAVATYDASVIDAFRQVADQLESLRELDRQEAAAHASLAAFRRAFDLATLRYKAGLADYLSVLVAQDRLLAEQRLVVDVESRRADLTVNLVRALGGGYGG